MLATLSRIQLCDGLARLSISCPNRLRTIIRCWLVIPSPFQEAPDESQSIRSEFPDPVTRTKFSA